jgi:2-succinyl-5-enolpyruvyl-6-hydroxy-3-cyclohexene-1-carboxylate synthase
MSFENKNYAFAGTFVEELARCGLKHVCICPGSRSSPLAISFARNKNIKKWVHLDERSAAFFALGIAKFSEQPVALVCSSGTAAANFSPAVIEAFYSGAPLLILTADRPPELHDWGALQTINQSNLYGNHVKWSAVMPTPEVTPPLLAFVRSAASRAFATACSAPAGPVHLNFPFREPLEPAVVPTDFPDIEYKPLKTQSESRPYLTSIESSGEPDGEEIARLAGEISGKRGLIIAGPDNGANAGSVTSLARRLGFPVLADCLSQIRCGNHDTDMVVDSYDLFLDQAELKGTAPEVIIRFGALPVSKPLTTFLDGNPQARHIFVDRRARWRNPSHTSAEIWHVDETRFCNSLTAAVKTRKRDAVWSRTWLDINAKVRAAVTKELAEYGEMFEGKIFHELARLLPANSVLFTGNSMPIRDMDTFSPASNSPIRFLANRGASGIDGVTSTALGASAISSSHLVLVLGDISFYHDMNGLLAAKAFGLNATIIVINNDGGGIFSFLPQSGYKNFFESYFGTPHGLTFQLAADMYGLDYALADTWPGFNDAVKRSLKREGTTIIEIPGNRERNLVLHRQIRKNIVSRVYRKGRRS